MNIIQMYMELKGSTIYRRCRAAATSAARPLHCRKRGQISTYQPRQLRRYGFCPPHSRLFQLSHTARCPGCRHSTRPHRPRSCRQHTHFLPGPFLLRLHHPVYPPDRGVAGQAGTSRRVPQDTIASLVAWLLVHRDPRGSQPALPPHLGALYVHEFREKRHPSRRVGVRFENLLSYDISNSIFRDAALHPLGNKPGC
jgi:hypothetical protein